MSTKGWFSKLTSGLSKSSSRLGEGIGGVLTRRRLDSEALEDLEEVLITADMGVSSAAEITQSLGRQRFDKEADENQVRRAVAELIAQKLHPVAKPLTIDPKNKPHVILVVGVNGVGKTTTIGKMAHSFQTEGKKVMLAACDTFRAAAVQQLRIWAERADTPLVSRDTGADAAGLAYDALGQAKAGAYDVLMIDTAGRLHNKADLMAELGKIVRVLQKIDTQAPHETLLVLDATTGQNALQQVGVFKEMIQISGLVLTKLDGSAKGGILIALADRFGLPVYAVGVGEKAEDLRPFDGDEFAAALLGIDSPVKR